MRARIAFYRDELHERGQLFWGGDSQLGYVVKTSRRNLVFGGGIGQGE